MSTAIVEASGHQITRIADIEYMLSPVIDLKLAKKRLEEFQEFVKEYLIAGEDYGIIPGTKKPCLFKSGADKLCDVYGLADEVIIMQQVEDWEKGLFDYVIKVIITKKGSGVLISTGIGSCSSYESKYRYRDSKRKCPSCGAEAIIKGREEYGGGWLCFAKKGGCGSKFIDSDKRIVDQKIGVTTNEDPADQKNTILKMAKKRAKIDAVLSATRSSGIFTQDLDEGLGDPDSTGPESHAPASQQATSQPQKAATATTQAPAPAAPAGRQKAPPAKGKTTTPAAKVEPAKQASAPADQPAKPAESTLPKAQIPPPVKVNGKPKDLKTWAREVATKVQSSPDQLVIFLRRVLRTDDLKSIPENQKIVALNALERVAEMSWPTGMNAVTAFVRNEGLTPDFQAVETAYADLLISVSDEPPAA